MFRRRSLTAVLATVLAVPASLVLAADPAVQGAAEVRPILVTATRIESSLATSPDAITIVTREQIEQAQARTVADVLQGVPGVTVLRNGQPGGQTSAFLRGANSGHTLVLVDGVRVNNAFSGRFDFVDLPVDNVERVEVVRGPQSTRYGSDALGGVINIVTRRGAARPAASLLVEGGGNASLRTRGAASGTLGGVGLSAEVGSLDTENERENGQFHTLGGSAGASLKVGPRLDLGLTVSHRESEAGTPNDRFINDPNDTTGAKSTLGALSAHALPAPWWDLRLSLAAGRERLRFDGPEPNPPFFSGDVRTRTLCDTQRADLQNVFTAAPGHQLFVGLSYDRTPVEHTTESAFGNAVIDRTVEASALSAQYDWSPARSFTASLGGRVDDFSTFGTHATWRAGARYTVAASGTILRANAGTGFHAPTVADLFYPGAENPDLKPEQSTGWDAGVEQPLFGGRLQVGAAWFSNEFDNLLAWSSTSFRMENVAEARTAGLEGFFQWQPAESLAVTGSYTWLSVAEDRATGARLTRRPEHTGSVAASYRFPRWVQVQTGLRFSGSSQDKHFAADYSTEDVTNDAYVKWDLGVTVSPWPHVALIGRVENLLDEDHEEAYGFPALGRVFWGGVKVDF